MISCAVVDQTYGVCLSSGLLAPQNPRRQPQRPRAHTQSLAHPTSRKRLLCVIMTRKKTTVGGNPPSTRTPPSIPACALGLGVESDDDVCPTPNGQRPSGIGTHQPTYRQRDNDRWMVVPCEWSGHLPSPSTIISHPFSLAHRHPSSPRAHAHTPLSSPVAPA
jgi:hypothetical protein